jgi:hypothetical protein
MMLRYDDKSTYTEIKEIIRGWKYVDILEYDDETLTVLLEGDEVILQRVKKYLGGTEEHWKETIVMETKDFTSYLVISYGALQKVTNNLMEKYPRENTEFWRAYVRALKELAESFEKETEGK